MNSILRVFNKRRILLPVIHVRGVSHALTNARVARDNGADGVLLINQGSVARVTLMAAHEVCKDHPDFWVGVNILGEDDLELLQKLRGTKIRGLWSDDACVKPQTTQEEAQARGVELQGVRDGWDGLYLAGVAFKYRDPVAEEHWGTVARIAAQTGVDVVMTSGPETGMAAEPTKLAAMRAAIEDHALGVASGIAEENVDAFLETTNVFVVASSLLLPTNGDNFDAVKVRRLSDRIPRT